MKSLKNYKKELLEMYLEMHWRQWSALGVQSHIPQSNFQIDIEALLISTFQIAPYDKRLFYAMLEWLESNRNFVSVSRVKSILKTLKTESEGKSYYRDTNFLIQILKEGSFKPPVVEENTDHQYSEILDEYSNRGVVQRITFNNTQLVQLKLRGIFGVNARADIILYLLSERKQNANKIGKEIYYDQKIVHRVLKNWEMSDFVRGEKSGNEILYSLNRQSIPGDLKNIKNREFINHPFLYFVLGRIISIFHTPEFNKDPYLISSRLRSLYRDITNIFNLINLKLEKEVNFPGDELFYYLRKKLPKLFNII